MPIFSCAPGMKTLPPEKSDFVFTVPGMPVWLPDLGDVLPVNPTVFVGPEERAVWGSDGILEGDL